MKVRLLITYSIFYGLIEVCFCIYWAANFTRHTTYKGDEFFVLVQFLLALTYLFYLAVQFSVKKIKLLLALLIPLMTCIAAFSISIVILLGTHLSGIPRQYIMTYGLSYGLLSLLAVYKFWGQTQKKIIGDVRPVL
jgi:hypothetical protein